MYCPQATICPYTTCGPDRFHSSETFGSFTPRNKHANTTLISIDGIFFHGAVTSPSQPFNDSQTLQHPLAAAPQQ
jgi:hypothetical protein